MLTIILALVTGIFFTGIIIRVKSLTSGRKGPDILQPLRDILRNLKKGSVYSETTSFIFKIAPSIYFSTIVASLFFIPFGTHKALISFDWDFVFLFYMLSMGKFLMVIASLDTGSSFEGMGASREAFFSMLIEPAMFMIMGSFAILTGHTSFSDIFSKLHNGSYPITMTYAISILSALIVMLIGMVENSRMPVDDPKTHLELTMIHEVMILDNSGFDLGLIMSASILKFTLFGAIAANLFLLPEKSLLINIAIYFAVQIFYAAFIGLTESFMARFRMKKNPQFIYTITAATLLIFIAAIHSTGFIGGN
ncbi:MAG TPA: NADH-quinone oxidoreductase subunit H [Spirochaetota bacterium]|nr:NADH-quinone oxidoreductase subunit H [Spirochaetota bacterium]HRU64483.1 NADH-quinone oxidoreductase subunit H [Spirochaetota bacterium]